MAATGLDWRYVLITGLFLVASGDEKAGGSFRLPGDVVPVSYVLSLIPFIIPDNFTISGSVSVNMRCVKGGSKTITLHSKDTDIKSIALKMGNQDVSVAGYDLDTARDFLIVDLDEALEEDASYTLDIDFVSRLSDGLSGIYRSQYKNSEGETVYLATSQFEPTSARKAFPCFDEPALKATFKVSIGRTKDMIALSNMPIIEGQKGVAMDCSDEYVWDRFEETVPMSTYLLAFIVSDFGMVEAEPEGNNVTVAIWSRKEALDQTEYARSIAAKVLKYFEDFYGVDYPLPKQDMIAIPDFSAGAMENWGLITYRETALLFTPGVSSHWHKQRIATVISHELAHQWFGNLVSPSWWSDLWLNEGFASFVEYAGVAAVEPGFKIMEQFTSDEMQSTMQQDAMESTHQISVPVDDPDQIREIFDGISYHKGASVLRMMEHFLTPLTFQKGLTAYLNALKFKAATQDDLWHHLTIQAHVDGTLPMTLDVKTIMDTWTLQPGFPLVTVRRHYDANMAYLTQERFVQRGFEVADQQKTYPERWWIPITRTRPGGNFDYTYNHHAWMDPEREEVPIFCLLEHGSGIILNVQQTGYFRVNYDVENWRRLMLSLESDPTSIAVANRAQLVDDAFNLARAGLVDYELALGMTRFLVREKNYVVWAAAKKNLKYIGKMLSRTGAYGDYQRYMRQIVHPTYKRVRSFKGLNDDDTRDGLDIHLKTTIVEWSCDLMLQECCDRAKKDFKGWMKSDNPDDLTKNPIDVDLKKAGYCNAVALGGEAEWKFVFSRYQASDVAIEKRNLLSALTCSHKIWLLNKLLHMTVDPKHEDVIRSQDIGTVVAGVARNEYGRDLAFDFVRNKWEPLKARLSGRMDRIVSVLRNRNTRFELTELEQFQSKYDDDLGTSRRAVAQAIESARINIAWMDNYYEKLAQWFKNAVAENGGSRAPKMN